MMLMMMMMMMRTSRAHADGADDDDDDDDEEVSTETMTMMKDIREVSTEIGRRLEPRRKRKRLFSTEINYGGVRV